MKNDAAPVEARLADGLGPLVERLRSYAAGPGDVESAADELLRLQDEVAELDAMREQLADLLSRTAIALRGPEPPLTRWGWHDLPERAAAAVAAVNVMQRAAAILAAPSHASDCAMHNGPAYTPSTCDCGAQDVVKHTPGPWTAKPWGNEEFSGWQFSAGGSLLPLDDVTGNPEEAEANARLIAQAPELKKQRDSLLDALRKVLDAGDREAMARMRLQNARENFGSSAREVKEYERAMIVASDAESKARALLLSLCGEEQQGK